MAVTINIILHPSAAVAGLYSQNRKEENTGTVTEYHTFKWIKPCVTVTLHLTPPWQVVNNTC